MEFQGALLKDRDVTFGIVIVKSYILSNKPEADRLIASFQSQVFGGHPVVLMAQNARGIPSYYGRKDIVDFMARFPISAIPWKEYTLS